MASESTQGPMNGTSYHAHHHPNHYVADPYNAHVPVNNSSVAPAGPANDSNKNEIPKDEVGWFFVEQYYTTLSRSPEKLNLFYSRHSKFVSGLEAQKVTVAVGQKAINERIAELDFQDCKVRVLNVDSQASFENILVSVIGEISNKAEPPRKFVQTFVLAEQPNGYYVLNDIFRYLADEDEEIVEEAPVAEAAAVEPEAPVEAVQEPQPTEPVAPEVESKVEEKAVVEPEVKPEVNGGSQAEEEVAPQTNGTSTKEQDTAPAPAIPAPVVPTPAEVKPEEPKQPEPAPAAAAAPAKAAPPAPVKEAPAPAKAVPMTWASIARKNETAAAAAAAAAPAQAAAPAAPAAQPKAQAPAKAATPQAGSSETTPAQAPSNDNAGWQTAGADNSKKQSRPQSVSAAGDEHVSAFVKNVNEKVDASLLRQTLARFGKLKYFDVNRQKNCAFVEFADTQGYNNAVSANPHQIGGEHVTVEERRARSTAYGGNAGFGPGRGGHRNRGDGRSASQGRGGFQKDAGRGGYASRGRGGGNVTPKGRSQAQAA